MIRIENWSVCVNQDNVYVAPETQRKHLEGEVYGHPSFADGQFIKTSSLTVLDMENNCAKTRNTEYTLGKIDPEYQKFLDEQKENSSVS